MCTSAYTDIVMMACCTAGVPAPVPLLYSRRSICEGTSSDGERVAELMSVLQQERYAKVFTYISTTYVMFSTLVYCACSL
jgi:hypothetical protein